MSEDTPLLLSVEEAARVLGIGKSLCYQLINAGKMPSMRMHDDGPVKVPRLLLEAWILEQSGDWAALVQPARPAPKPKAPIALPERRKQRKVRTA